MLRMLFDRVTPSVARRALAQPDDFARRVEDARA
jgi:hypothetical protein